MLLIADVHPATSAEWDEIWKNCDYATYFHSREWAEVWQKYSEGKMQPDPKLVVFSDGKRALLPLTLKEGIVGFPGTFLSSPAGTFGGWISIDELDNNHSDALTKFLLNDLGGLVWRINPWAVLPILPDSQKYKQDETQVLDLRQGFDSLFKNWTKSHASAAKKAKREGVLIREAESYADWLHYFDVYKDTLRRWDDQATSRYGFALFEDLYRLNSNCVKLWIGEYENQVICGALCFYAKKHVVYWHGAALERYFRLCAFHLLFYKAIQEACATGYQWFDFNPSGGHEGVKEFKRRFGTLTLPSPIIRIETLSTEVWVLITEARRRIFGK